MEKTGKTPMSVLDQLENQINSFISNKTFKEALESIGKESRLQFLKDYYLSEGINYDKTKKNIQEESKYALKNLKNSKNPQEQTQLVGSVIMLAKMSIMDRLLESFSQTYIKLREKLQGKRIDDFQTIMVFQLAVGQLTM